MYCIGERMNWLLYHNLPFSQDIRNAPLPIEFKLPMITPYKGKIDLQKHLIYFNDLMELH